MSDRAAAPVIDRRVAWTVAITAAAIMTVSQMDRTTFSVLAKAVTDSLGISDTGYGVLQAVFSAAYLITTPLAGRWLERIGARRGLVGSVLAWSAVAALHALVPGFFVLLVLRFALGIAEGPGFPGGAQTMHRVLPEKDRSRAYGMLFMGSSIGFMLIPPFATWMYREHGWRYAFLITSAAGSLWVPLWLLVTRRRDVRAVLDHRPEPDEPTAPTPRIRDLARHPQMHRAWIVVFAVAPTVGFLVAFTSKFLIKQFHIDQGDVGGYLWVPPLALDAGAFLFGDLAARMARASGPARFPRALMAVAAVLAACLALAPLATTPWQAVAVFAASMGGGGGMYTLATSELLARMPPQVVSVAGGTIASAQSLALVIAQPLMGAGADHFGDYNIVCIILGLWVVPGTLAWLLWRTPRE